MTEANKFEKLVFLNLERDNEQGALEAYVSYRWWTDFATNYMKGQI